MEKNKDNQLIEAAGIVYLTDENSVFFKNGDFIGAKIKKEHDEITIDRVNLHRLFPYDKPYRYITVLNEDSEEIGIITDIDTLDVSTKDLLKNELNRKYYICELKSLVSVKDRFGFSYWKAKTNDSDISFTIKDVHSSVRLDGNGYIMISDIDGNRYKLPPLKMLDSKSKKIIELYL